jgi:hypothetical protein
MKNITAAPTPDISAGDLELQMLKFSHAELAPGFEREPSFYENFPRFTNGSARCESRLEDISGIKLARTTGGFMEIH